MTQNKSPPAHPNPVGFYVLDPKGNPVPEPDVRKWAAWFEENDRTVVLDVIGEATISTVFLGIDHNHLSFLWPERGPPILWETVIFGGLHDQYQERYASRDAAVAGHQKALKMAKEGLH